MPDLKLTDSELERVAYYVRSLMRKESKAVGEVPLVETLDGIESLPTLRVKGGVTTVVRVPVKTLAEPAWEAVEVIMDDFKATKAAAETATNTANTAATNADKATAQSKAQTVLAQAATIKADELLKNPPKVVNDILYIYDLDTHSYKNTGLNMKGSTGYYFTPSVDSSGNITWTNNGGLSNPKSVNIRGPRGFHFIPRLDPTDGMLHWSNDGGLENPEPIRVEGNVMHATFEIDWDTGDLVVRTVPEYKGAGFELDEETGNFYVLI